MISKNVEHFRRGWAYAVIPRPLLAMIVRWLRRRIEREAWERREKWRESYFEQVQIRHGDGTVTRGYKAKPWPGLKK